MCRGKGTDGWAAIPLGLWGKERLFRTLWPPNLGGLSDGLDPQPPNLGGLSQTKETEEPLT